MVNETALDFARHLAERGLVASGNKFTYWQDTKNQLVTFPLWTMYGQLVGYQQYDWRAGKEKSNDCKGRYCTYRRKDSLTAWGLEYLSMTEVPKLYVCEGVFDAVSVMNAGKACVATLSNNPKQLKRWLASFPCKTVALCEGDKAGKMLVNCCDEAVYLPTGHDANSMDVNDLVNLLK